MGMGIYDWSMKAKKFIYPSHKQEDWTLYLKEKHCYIGHVKLAILYWYNGWKSMDYKSQEKMNFWVLLKVVPAFLPFLRWWLWENDNEIRMIPSEWSHPSSFIQVLKWKQYRKGKLSKIKLHSRFSQGDFWNKTCYFLDCTSSCIISPPRPLPRTSPVHHFFS